MAKKKKTEKKENEIPKLEDPKILTDEDRLKALEKMNKLSGSQVITLPDDAVVNIPISGFFKRSVEGVFFHLLEDLEASEILKVMDKIKKGFEDVDPKTVKDRDRALWCIMTLLSEIHWQADAQDKNIVTEQKVGNLVTSILTGVKGAKEQLANVAGKNTEEEKSNED
jgi:hypothetical protein